MRSRWGVLHCTQDVTPYVEEGTPLQLYKADE